MIALRQRHREARARVRILRSEEAERVPETGAVRSLQEAEVIIPEERMAELWKPEYLERLARSYWRWLSRVTLGLIRVVYEPDARLVVLVSRRLPLLTFHAPEYQTGPGRGTVTWRIERGLLVAREGRDRDGFLQIRVCREAGPGASGETIQVALEVRNFYPWMRGTGRFARLGAWLYGQTQLRIHVVICNAFLRSLARLDLPPSRVGALVDPPVSGPSASGS